MNIVAAIALGLVGGAAVVAVSFPRFTKEKAYSILGRKMVLHNALDIFDVFGEDMLNIEATALTARYSTLKSEIRSSSPFVDEELARLEDFHTRAILFRQRIPDRRRTSLSAEA